MTKFHIKSIFSMFFALALAAVSVLTPAAVFADGTKDVGVSPPTQKMTIAPGETYEGSFTIYNKGTDDFDFTLESIPYSVTNENYDPDYGTRNSYNQLTDWITLSRDKGSLKAGSDTEVNFTITVPEDVPYGGQYAAIATSVVNNETGSLQTVTRVAMILYVKVPGETKEEGAIIENNVPSFVFGGNNVAATSVVENKGNVHETATYTLRVYPFGSDEEVYTTEESPATRTILPETRCYNTVTWEDTPSFGLYTVEQTIDYMGQTSTTKKLILICPLWLLVIFIALIFAIIFTLVSRARARKTAAAESSSKRGKNSDKNSD